MPAGLATKLLEPDAQRHHLAGSGPEAFGDAYELPAGRPVAVLLADAEDQLGPVAHGDVLALAVDVDVARDSVQRDHQVAAHAVGAEAEVAHRLQLAELDMLANEGLCDDRAGDEARVLARPVVVEHTCDHAGHGERVVVVHGEEVSRHLGRRVDRLGVDRGALVEDHAAVLVEVVVVGDRLAHVAVLLGGAGGVELLQLEAVVDDRLEQVERADNVRHHGLVRAVPRLAHVRLGAEVEEVRAVRRLLEVADHVVDRGAVGEVGEDDPHPVAQVGDVVQRAARGRAHEGDHVGSELDQRLGEVGAHEPVCAGDENGAAREGVTELLSQARDRLGRPQGVAAQPVHRGED